MVYLLIETPMPQVRQLITVASQAGFFYENDALVSLAFPEPLPAHIPPWRNIFDPADFRVPGRAMRFQVDNGQPLPQAHSAYWDNPEVIAEIERRLR